jgi:glutathione S-transferase
MSSHELIYFDTPGRAEGIRLCLHIAKADWKDTRISDWPSVKPTTPLGSVPVLKIDGVGHCQSTALLRYAGKLAGWYPSDPVEGLTVDEAVDTLNELMSKAPHSSDPEELKKKREEYQATTMTKYAAFLEGMIQRNGGSGFASTASIADLAMMSTVGSIESGSWTHINAQFFEAYPGIMATAKATKENEQVVDYYKSKK